MTGAGSGAWRRRAITIPALSLAWVVVIGAAPLLVTLALLVDLVRVVSGQRRFPTIRAYAFIAAYLTCEVVGIKIATLLWLRGVVTRVDDARWIAWHFRLQSVWTSALFGAAKAIYGLDVHAEGVDQIGRGPMLVFMRHTSVADTVLPGVFVQSRGIVLRYVLKRELLFDPCLDIVGHRLRNHFVRRDSRDAQKQAQEIAAVGALADGLGENEGVLVYPEGTRFTPRRRAAVLEKLRANNDPNLARAEALQHVLPPRLGGPLALLSRDVDVVFCAHTGFEGTVSLPAFFGGALIGRRIDVGFWRVPASARIADPTAWLFEAWSDMDAWVREHTC